MIETGYWIWNRIIENLASLGYDPTNSFTAAYDWRLSYPNLEVRDQYFTRLKFYIEMAVHTANRKVVIVSHSMGSQVLFYFFHWVASRKGGRGGQDWVDRHVDSWINLSGCMLGAVKDLTAVLSGEMRDTAVRKFYNNLPPFSFRPALRVKVVSPRSCLLALSNPHDSCSRPRRKALTTGVEAT